MNYGIEEEHVYDFGGVLRQSRRSKWCRIELEIDKETLIVRTIEPAYRVADKAYPFTFTGKHRPCGGNVYWYDGVLYCKSCNEVIDLEASIPTRKC